MKFSTSLIAVLVLAAVAYGFYQWGTGTRGAGVATTTDETPSGTTRLETYSNEKYGISFSYPDSYQLDERLNPGSAQREHYSIILTPKADLPAPEGGEGPPTINFDIYQNNLDNQDTEEWIRNTAQSNFKLSPEGRLSSTTVDGKDALSYRWDGLYQGTTIAIAQPDWVYAFSVTYLEMGADIIQDYAAIMDTVRIAR